MPCPACGSARSRVLWKVGDRLFRVTDETFTMRRCATCGALFLFPPPRAADLARYYPEGYWLGPAPGEDGASGAHRRLIERYRRVVLRDHVRFVGRVVGDQRRRSSPVRLLDVGCGDGSVLAALGLPFAVGLDSSPSAARAARARGLAVLRGSLIDAPFPVGTFAVVTMFHVIEHLPDPRPYLTAARSLLRERGVLVVQVPNAAGWQAAWLGRRWSGFDVPRHLVNYSPAALRDVLARHGFQVVRETQYSLRDNAVLLASSLLPTFYPPARPTGERAGRARLRDAAFLAATVAALPLTLIESACGRGATVMMEARRAD